MRKFSVLISLVFSGVLVAFSAPVTPEQAKEVAQRFVKSSAAHLAPRMGAVAPQLAYTARDANYYAFNLGREAGFVLVAGDDRAPSVLAYSDEGAFDFATLPENARAWLEGYEAEMNYLKRHPESNGRKAIKRDRVVQPLIKSIWNQDAPFNNLCPAYENKRTFTGCVATAMAQVMYYHQWPPQGQGSNSYEDQVGDQGEGTEELLSRDFSESVYQWDQMLPDYTNSYSIEQGEAVARLMADCGIAVNMHYGSRATGSAAHTIAARDALVNHFDYDATAQFVFRDKYTGDEWEQLLVDELNAARPVMYAGNGKGGGHEFVCDGYNSDGYFHFNWGWSGHGNGYFLLTSLNPSEQGTGSFEGGYNNEQEMVIGIKPNQGGEPLPEENELYISGFTPKREQMKLGEVIHMPIKGGRFFYSGQPEAFYVGFHVFDKQGNKVDGAICRAVEAGKLVTKGVAHEWNTYYYPKEHLPEGDYDIYAVRSFRVDLADIARAKTPPGKPDHVLMTIKDGMVYFSQVNSTPSELVVNSINVAPTITANRNASVTVELGCNNGEYNANVTLALLDGDGDVAYQSNAMLVDLCAERTLTLNCTIKPNVSVGDYTLVLLNNANEVEGNGVPVTVTNDAVVNLAYSDFCVIDEFMPADDLRATVRIVNNGSHDFYGKIESIVRPVGSNSILTSPISDNVLIPAGEETTLLLTGNGILGEGNTYEWFLINPNWASRAIWGEPCPFTVRTARPTVTLSQLLDEGTSDTDYHIANDIVIMSEMDPDGNVYATDGLGKWVCLADYPEDAPTPFVGMTLKGNSITGFYTLVNGNPTLTLSTLPFVGDDKYLQINEYHLDEPFAPAPCEVMKVTGYYETEGGTPKLRGHSSAALAQGQSLDLDFGWCSGTNNMEADKVYSIHGVVRLKSAWDQTNQAPRRMAADDPLAFQNYKLNAYNYPAITTAIGTIKAGDATVKSVRYVNALGHTSDHPFNGLNIVVTTLTDGTVKTAKVVF